jgi:amino acid transporter
VPPPGLKRELGLRDLTLFAVVCIFGPRWIAIAAHAGPASITLWIAAALFFAVPLGVAVAALMAKYPGAGGLYLWTRQDFGSWHGFLAFWTYWFAIALTLPSSAMATVSTSAYAFGPSHAYLADSRAYVLIVSLSAIAIALGTNLVGMRIGKWTENLGGITGWLLGAVLVTIGVLVYMRQGSATDFNLKPAWNWDTLSFFGSIAYALSGMEFIGMMSAEIRQPGRIVRPAIWIATAVVTLFYIATTAALLVMLAPESIQILHGLADGGDVAARVLGWVWVTPFVVVLFMLASIGSWGGMGSAVSRMPYAAGVDALLPPAFSRIHPRWHTPYISLLAFGLVTFVLLLLLQVGETMRAAFQTLVSLMVIAGFIPYLYLFGSAWKAGRRVAAACGIVTTSLAIASSVVPTPDITNVWAFEIKILVGTALMIGSAWVVYRRAITRPAAPPADPMAPRASLEGS